MSELSPLSSDVLPAGIRARFVSGINGLRMHILEAGSAAPGRPAVLLLHGFPELAYSWRKIMPALAAAGYHVIAPDQRGYGRTTGWSANYDDDLRPFRLLNAVRDALGLVAALGYRSVASVVGHDFGASIAAWCALVRPDVFRSVALMSAPFGGPPDLPFDTERHPPAVPAGPTIHEALAALPRPRKHYQWWYSTRAGERSDVALPAGRPRLPARLLPSQERRLEGQPAASAGRVVGGRAGEDADLLHHGPRRRHADGRGQGDAVTARDRRLPVAARRRAGGLCRRVSAHRVSGRAQLVPLAQRRRVRVRTAAVLRADHRRAVDLHLGHRATGASTSGPAPSSACRTRRAPVWSAVTCSRAPGTGCSRSRRPGSASCSWTS